MKTVKYYFSQLKEPYKSQALKNSSKDALAFKCESISEALTLGFTWIFSNESHNYWSQVFHYPELFINDNTEKEAL